MKLWRPLRGILKPECIKHSSDAPFMEGVQAQHWVQYRSLSLTLNLQNI